MKMRTDFVTNSSSSSFILAFKDQRDAYAEICEAFLRYREYMAEEYVHEDEENNCECFDEHSCAVDNILWSMEQNKMTAEEAVNEYISRIAWYPVLSGIRDEMYRDVEHYPRKSLQDFNEKYNAVIESRKEERLSELRKQAFKMLADKQYITMVEFEDSYPESVAHHTCQMLDQSNVLLIDHD